MEGEGPNTVTPTDDVGREEEQGAMGAAGKGGGDVGKWPFWDARAGQYEHGGDKMAGLATLLVPFCEGTLTEGDITG